MSHIYHILNYAILNYYPMVSYDGKELSSYEIALLRKMFNHAFIGGRHTDENSVIRGFPGHDLKKVKKALKKLVKTNLVLNYKSTGQVHVSLNPFLIPAIKIILDESLDC